MEKVLIICNAGMSSSVMAKKTTAFLQEKGHDIVIEATTAGAGGDVFKSDQYKLILISPQIRHKFDQFKNQADENGVNIAQIGFDAYAPIPSGIEKMANLVLENL